MEDSLFQVIRMTCSFLTCVVVPLGVILTFIGYKLGNKVSDEGLNINVKVKGRK